MKSYSLSHLSDQTVDQGLTSEVGRERGGTATVLAYVAEFDARRLYVPAGYPSMRVYCIEKLHFSEQAAYKRIHVARAARKFPVIFEAVAAGRLHLSGLILLVPNLTPDNAAELLDAATHRTRAEIELILAQRFPRSDMPTRIEPVAPLQSPTQVTEQASVSTTDSGTGQLSPGRVGTADPPAPVQVGAPRGMTSQPRPKVTPLAPQRFALQLTMSQELHDKLRYAQELLSHQIPHGDVAAVLDRALDSLIAQLEKRKFAATSKPRPRRGGRVSANPRHIPAHVRRAVRKRDGGQCTFVSATGRRCSARKFLEFDHIEEVARGGGATVGNLRLRCRAHNQYEAERTFGAEFMRSKREEARRAAEARRSAETRREQTRAKGADAARRAADEVRRMTAEARFPARGGRRPVPAGHDHSSRLESG